MPRKPGPSGSGGVVAAALCRLQGETVETRHNLGETAGGDSVGTHSHLRVSPFLFAVQERFELGRPEVSLRGPPAMNEPIIRMHDLEIDTAARLVKRAGQTIHLTPREYAILELLAMHRETVVSRPMVWEHLYGAFGRHTSNIVDVYIRHLRTKIDTGFDPPLIRTCRGKGYKLAAPE
jgi:DNA-binding response OmpR family regulator